MRFGTLLCVVQFGMMTTPWLHFYYSSYPHVVKVVDDGVRETPFEWNFTASTETTCAPTGPTVQLTVDQIGVGILTATQNFATRLHAQRRTWLRLVPHKVFYSEAVPGKQLNLEERLMPIVFVEPSPYETLVGGGAWKNFPALIDLYKRFPRQEWFLITVSSSS